jgi:uncharacterized protein (TIGR04168 family)
MSFNIGIIGDLHAHWDEVDVAQLNASSYDLLFFVGDLGSGARDSTLKIARLLSRLNKPTLVLPGNHDTWDLAELSAELSHREGLRKLNTILQGSRPESGVANASLCGFSSHRLTQGDVDVTLIVARPHSMGGPDVAFPEYMAEYYGVGDIAASQRRICELVDGAQTQRLLFFAHNGPLGLGDRPEDMWGCDFRPGGGDWGDPDLAHAIDYARERGHVVQAVVGGHMHLRTKQGEERPWMQHVKGATIVNAARVPRIFSDSTGVHRHHIAMRIDADSINVSEEYYS